MRDRSWTIYRDKRGKPIWFQRWLEAVWIITGRWSLHRAWQQGHDAGTAHEHERLIYNGAWRAEVEADRFNRCPARIRALLAHEPTDA